MKYIKHMSNSSSDDFIVELEEVFGLEGYARWWKLLEAIASQMKNSDDYSLAYPWSKWQIILKGRRKKLEEFLTFCEARGKIVLVQKKEIVGRNPVETQQKPGSYQGSTEFLDSLSENELIISCPKLKEIKDNYTRDLVVATKQLPSPNKEVKEKEDKDMSKFSFSDDDMPLAIFFFDTIRKTLPKFKEPCLESWANEIRLIRERDNRTPEEIKSLFLWANNDPFWRSNIQCPKKLRDKWDRLESQKNSRGNSSGYISQADLNSSSTGEFVA